MSTNQFSGTAMADLIAGRLNENDLQILATKPVQGLDVPPKRMALEDRYGDGVEGGPQFSQQREIVVPLGTRSFDVVQQLAAVFDPVGDPDAELVLTFVGLGRDAETTWRCWVVPDVLSFDVDQTATASEWWAMSARYIAKDPVIYSDEPRRPPLPHQPVGGDTPGRPRAVNGTISYLPALFGVMLAGVVIHRLLGDCGGT